MKIIHGHDYYDGALAFGSDSQVVFVREKNRTLSTQEAAQVPGLQGHHSVIYLIDKHRTYHSNHHSLIPLSNGEHASVTPFRIWVADQNWLGYKVTTGVKSMCYYDWQSFERWAQQMGYTARRVNPYWYLARGLNPVPEAGGHRTDASIVNWMIQNRITIITCEGLTNPAQLGRINGDNLKDYQLYKQCDAHSMFQIISQWVGGILPGQANPMVEIVDDKIKAHKHGFDKHSFRRMPSKNKGSKS